MSANPKSILIVDDEETIVRLITLYLSDEGYRVESSGTARDALDRISRKKPDLVLLDIILPDLDGIETLKKIKAIDRKIPVVIVTGIFDNGEAQIAFDSGASDYITKPIDFQYLKDSVLLQL